jgi:hypothetical protein
LLYFSFHGDLIYGRLAEAREREGICLSRTKTGDDKYTFALITYVAPTLSARAIPQLLEFAGNHLK